MKKLLILNLIGLFILSISFVAHAQDKKKEKAKDKTVKLKVEKIENGKKTVIDTTFTLKKDEDLDKALEKYGINAKTGTGQDGTFKVEIETNDSTGQEKKNMVWINVENGDVEKIHVNKDGSEKSVIITDDGNVKVFDDDETVVIADNDGDTSKRVEKIIRKRRIPGDKRKMRVYKFDSENMSIPDHSFFYGDVDGDLNKVIIKELGDSIDVFISKIIGDELPKHLMLPNADDFVWHNDNDFVFKPGHFMHLSAKVKLEAPSDADLGVLKLDKNYKKLDLDEFMVVFNGSSMDLSFIAEEKGDLSVNILDEKGNSSVAIELKDFKGKFDKEIELPMGNSILQITQNKKHFVKKLLVE